MRAQSRHKAADTVIAKQVEVVLYVHWSLEESPLFSLSTNSSLFGKAPSVVTLKNKIPFQTRFPGAYTLSPPPYPANTHR